ncbi:hypothetical protein [Novosphingobium sp. HII-3]|uniref:hypothetical protein n=1 Tax=Novosphingobium sp. HII-3 TaxID=2075565 RepID=UPI001E3CDF2A|nr:hypothetical protein [Novosphingobium sp. HII-3]
MGKTSACIAFLKSWRRADYQPASSVLIALSTKEELRAFIDEAGLHTSDFGVLTSDAEMNNFGLPRADHHQAKVMFTTQAMIRRRIKDKTFREASEFHYQGQPRALRIWDEDVLPSGWQTVRVDLLNGLAIPLRSHFPDFISKLHAFREVAEAKKPGEVITVPEDLIFPADRYEAALRRIEDENLKTALETLQDMAGTQVRIVASTYSGNELLSVFKELPDDMAPMVVVDASGRVREAYRTWEEYRGNIERLKPASNSYHNVNVHFWRRGAGKDALADEETIKAFAEAIVGAFELDPKGEWLIVTRKDAKEDLEAAIRALAPSLPKERLYWRTWGLHRSTNEFRDVENIVIVGQLRYSPSSYEGLCLASAGLPVTASEYPDPRKLEAGELKHHLFQAVCRASVRKAQAGAAPHCNVFIIDNLSDAELTMEELFPGHNFIRWKEAATLTNERVKAAIDALHAQMPPGTATRVSKSVIRDAAGITRSQDFTELLAHPEMRRFLDWADIEVGYHHFKRDVERFVPIANG